MSNPTPLTGSRPSLDIPHDALHRIVRLAGTIFNAKTALIAFVGPNRQLNVARLGPVPEEVSPEVSFCAHTLRMGQRMVIEDAQADARFATNPFVQADDGLRFYAGAPIRTADGQPKGTVSVFDSSPLAPTPTQLARLDDLADLASDLLRGHLRERQYETALNDPDTLLGVLRPDGTIVDVGDAALAAVGADREAVLGQKAWESPWVVPIDRAQQAVRRSIEEAATTGRAVSFDTAHPGPGGRRMIRGSIRPVLGPEQDVASLMVVAQDVTEPKRRLQHAEQRLQQAQQDLQHQTTLLAAMSHEVRSPLTSILGFAYTIQHTADASNLTRSDSDAPGISMYAEAVQTSAYRLLDAMEGVMTLARLELGDVDPPDAPVDLAEEARRIVEQFHPQAAEDNIDLTVEAPDPVLAAVHPDRVRLCLRNLVSNAVKYTESGGSVVVRAWTEDGADLEGAGTMVLEVEDTGIGMDPDTAETMFDAFRRSGDAPTRGADGTGLGLSLVQRVVHQMSGSIGIDTEKGRGTRVTVKLPKTER